MEDMLTPDLIDAKNLTKRPKSLVLPLSLLLLGTALGGTFLYLNTTYPEVFANPVERLYNTITSPSRQAATTKLADSTNSNPLPTRSPYPLIPDTGKAGNFNVSTGTNKAINLQKVTIDPLDPELSEQITITLTIQSSIDIDQVTANLETDSSPQTLSFKRESSTNNVEVWVAKFKLKYPVKYKYIYKFKIQSADQVFEFPMGLRT